MGRIEKSVLFCVLLLFSFVTVSASARWIKTETSEIQMSLFLFFQPWTSWTFKCTHTHLLHIQSQRARGKEQRKPDGRTDGRLEGLDAWRENKSGSRPFGRLG